MRTTPVGRNEPCPCGSGRKFKVCCQAKEQAKTTQRSTTFYVVVGLAALAVAVLIGRAAFSPATSQRPETAASGVPAPSSAVPAPVRSGGLTPQPPGPVPAGKVWSAEHGHWHDAPSGGNQAITVTPSSTGTLTPQPPGPVPEGKVWSPQHGHWHDVPSARAQTVTVTPSVSPPAATPAAPLPPTPSSEVAAPTSPAASDTPVDAGSPTP